MDFEIGDYVYGYCDSDFPYVFGTIVHMSTHRDTIYCDIKTDVGTFIINMDYVFKTLEGHNDFYCKQIKILNDIQSPYNNCIDGLRNIKLLDSNDEQWIEQAIEFISELRESVL